MRVVVDTNILIASIFWNGAPYTLVQQALDRKYEIVVSSLILNEVRKTLQNDFELGEQEINDVINCILFYTSLVEPVEIVPVIERDPTDDHIIACAIAAKARYIITRDNDLLDLNEYAGIKILTPETFLQIND